MTYVESHNKYYTVTNIPKGEKPKSISGTEVRRRLKTGEDIPEWFSPKSVVKILRHDTSVKYFTELNNEIAGKNPVDIIRKSLEEHGDQIAISFSGAEDVLLIEYAHQTGLPYRVFTLDTGRMFAENYDFINEV